MVFEVCVSLPVAAYLLWRFPGWSVMYLVDEAAIPWPAWSLAALSPLAALGAYLGARGLDRRLGWKGPATLTCAAVGVAAALAWFGGAQLLVVGSTAQFRGGGALRSVAASPLPYFLAVASAVTAGVWGATLWRLGVVRLAANKKKPGAAAKPRGGDTVELSDGDGSSGGAKRRRKK